MVGRNESKNALNINEDKGDLVVSADLRKSVKETEQTACETAHEEEESKKKRSIRERTRSQYSHSVSACRGVSSESE